MNEDLRKKMIAACEKLGLKKTDITVDASFIRSTGFWETKYENVFITDYNVMGDINCTNTLEAYGIVTIFREMNKKLWHQKFSFDIMNDIEFMNKFIDEFYLLTEK